MLCNFKKIMRKNILEYFQETSKGFIHPKEKAATSILLQNLNPLQGEKILEIGFGTGTSLVKVFSKQNKFELCGVEKNKNMIERTYSRLKFCGIAKKNTLKQ